MRFGKAVIDLERFRYGPLGLRPGVVGRQNTPCCPVAVVAVQPAVTERVGWILFDRAMKVLTAFLVLLWRGLPPVVSALQVQLVCLCVLGLAFCQPRPVFIAEF